MKSFVLETRRRFLHARDCRSATKHRTHGPKGKGNSKDSSSQGGRFICIVLRKIDAAQVQVIHEPSSPRSVFPISSQMFQELIDERTKDHRGCCNCPYSWIEGSHPIKPFDFLSVIVINGFNSINQNDGRIKPSVTIRNPRVETFRGLRPFINGNVKVVSYFRMAPAILKLRGAKPNLQPDVLFKLFPASSRTYVSFHKHASYQKFLLE